MRWIARNARTNASNVRGKDSDALRPAFPRALEPFPRALDRFQRTEETFQRVEGRIQRAREGAPGAPDGAGTARLANQAALSGAL